MNRYFQIPWLFLSVAMLIGIVLRWNLTSPISDFNYPYFLHAHSHLMFLGWVMNFLMLAYIHQFVPQHWKTRYKTIFILLQLVLVGMSISFPLQGYGLYSIILSTLHTVLFAVFIVRFHKDTKVNSEQRLPSLWFVRASFVFFLLSAIGPFTLAPIMAMGYGETKWYYFAVYYYLHFQYNGVFTFGVLGLFFKLLEAKQIQYSFPLAFRFGKIMAVACVFAYILSILWAKLGVIFNGIGFVAAVGQLVGYFMLVKIVLAISKDSWKSINQFTKFIFLLVFIIFGMKLWLQWLSSFQFFASLAYVLRSFLIAYLHMVFIGIVSFFIIGWYVEMGFMKNARLPFFVLLISFIGMEVLLMFRPFYNVGTLILLATVLLGAGVLQCTSRVVTSLRDNSS